MVLGAVLGAIPKVDGFSPLPLGIMAPFMAYQSATMAFAFGLNYEIGKRTIKAMSNETFNSLTPEDIENLHKNNHNVNIATFIAEIPHTRDVQDLILKEMVHLEGEKFKLVPKIIQEIGDSTWELIFGEVNRIENIAGNNTSGSGGRSPGGSREPEDRPAIEETQPSPSPTTGGRRQSTTAHISSHNDILTKYDEAKRFENELIKLETRHRQATASGHRSASDKLFHKHYEKALPVNKSRLLQIMALIGALQKNHQKNYGHQVTPYSNRL